MLVIQINYVFDKFLTLTLQLLHHFFSANINFLINVKLRYMKLELLSITSGSILVTSRVQKLIARSKFNLSGDLQPTSLDIAFPNDFAQNDLHFLITILYVLGFYEQISMETIHGKKLDVDSSLQLPSLKKRRLLYFYLRYNIKLNSIFIP